MTRNSRIIPKHRVIQRHQCPGLFIPKIYFKSLRFVPVFYIDSRQSRYAVFSVIYPVRAIPEIEDSAAILTLQIESRLAIVSSVRRRIFLPDMLE